jgi:hypothetical protein
VKWDWLDKREGYERQEIVLPLLGIRSQQAPMRVQQASLANPEIKEMK